MVFSLNAQYWVRPKDLKTFIGGLVPDVSLAGLNMAQMGVYFEQLWLAVSFETFSLHNWLFDHFSVMIH